MPAVAEEVSKVIKFSSSTKTELRLQFESLEKQVPPPSSFPLLTTSLPLTSTSCSHPLLFFLLFSFQTTGDSANMLLEIYREFQSLLEFMKLNKEGFRFVSQYHLLSPLTSHLSPLISPPTPHLRPPTFRSSPLLCLF